MFELAFSAACVTDCFPVRIWASIVRRMFPFSTSTQCFAAGTNQLRAAARSFTLEPRRLVAFGMLPFACSAFSFAVLVKSLIQSAASALFELGAGTARSDPPRKPGIALPGVWLGMTNCAVTDLYFVPVQQLNQPGPMMAPAPPCEKMSYGAGLASFEVLLAREAASQKFFHAVSPATDCGESRAPTHLCAWVYAIVPP